MDDKEVPGASPAPLLRLSVLKKRADFLRAARGRRQATPGFVLQGWNRKDPDPPRVGFTCSKKVGNAVARNRAKRRLREIAQLELRQAGQPGWDYVLIGRHQVTAARDFVQLREDLQRALNALHGRKP
ncbi:Ribonuclease P protein component [Candidatus Rhodobacter oscarellae]|uniref:Ribonuclease P protein component n=1 Tax=Candidatus Rhodobacter oscarellae TaxID=1675527 RepID=A0A0J9EEF1_9RHOB|nr:ribonuclease P protein component [Candidatus Rhodobacter lobularis]KMW60094.1 Ribonuclease P protein component [Candidatus Rhodobacter lobularis]